MFYMGIVFGLSQAFYNTWKLDKNFKIQNERQIELYKSYLSSK